MTNLYAIQRTDQIRPTRYYEYAATSCEAVAQWRKYWNRKPTEDVTFELVQKNVRKPFGGE